MQISDILDILVKITIVLHMLEICMLPRSCMVINF